MLKNSCMKSCYGSTIPTDISSVLFHMQLQFEQNLIIEHFKKASFCFIPRIHRESKILILCLNYYLFRLPFKQFWWDHKFRLFNFICVFPLQIFFRFSILSFFVVKINQSHIAINVSYLENSCFLYVWRLDQTITLLEFFSISSPMFGISQNFYVGPWGTKTWEPVRAGNHW